MLVTENEQIWGFANIYSNSNLNLCLPINKDIGQKLVPLEDVNHYISKNQLKVNSPTSLRIKLIINNTEIFFIKKRNL